MLTHVVADTLYGFLYTRDTHEHPLNQHSAEALAGTLNECMPAGCKDYVAYELVPVAEIKETHAHLDAIERMLPVVLTGKVRAMP